MEIEVNETIPQSPRKYPYLGISRHNLDLVMFVDHDSGLLIREGAYPGIGGEDLIISDWDESGFSPFKGTLVIS